MLSNLRGFWARFSPRYDVLVIFCLFSVFYMLLAWIVCGGERWWIIDYVDNSNIFYGDDAYRFFLARSAWINPDLYSYNFALPGFLVLDGIVASLAGGDLLWARCIHALLGAAALCVVWDITRQLGVNLYIRLAMLLVMGLLPRYALMSLSFYGEVWLGFILCFLSWFFLRQQFLVVAVLTSLLPLIRPEGIFFLAPLFAFMVLKRRWKEAALMILPGFLYFLYLNIHFASLHDYMYWRFEQRRLLSKLVMNRGDWDVVSTYSLWLTVPALLGIFFTPVRRLWPVLLGAFLYVAFLQINYLRGLQTYEDRYAYILIPTIVILWGSFFSWLWNKLPQAILGNGLRAGAVILLAFVVVVQHVGSMLQIKRGIQAYGLVRMTSYMLEGEWHRLFSHYTPSQTRSWQLLDEKIEGMLSRDHAIDKVVIFDSGLYYFLNPHAIPRHVTVGYPSSGYMIFHALLNGQAFIQHPGGKMYSYLHYGKPDFHQGERRVLCVDLMPLQNYPYSWTAGGYELYMFAYAESLTPAIDIDNAPMLTPAMVDNMYRSWALPQQ